MPKKAEYAIRYSHITKGYELVHSPFSYPLDSSSALWVWFGLSSTFSFCSPTGETFTLRKETKQRGGGYWYAYKRVHGRVEKKYIGEQSKVTLEALEALAVYFADLASPTPKPPPAAPPPPQPPPTPKPPPRKPMLPKFEKSLVSALSIYGFSKTPTRKELISRYRELSKLHHPDTGGLHEDMVTVNLAYDYLKNFV
jgi:hypothetical protein